MLQGLSETQPSRLEPDYSMNQKKKEKKREKNGVLLFKMKECVLTFRASCGAIVWSVEVIC